MEKLDFRELIENHPNLTVEGLGVNMDYANGKSRREYIALRWDELKEELDDIELCLDWLRDHPSEGMRSAHYRKDRVQFFYKPDHPGHFHIPRGVFVLAALY